MLPKPDVSQPASLAGLGVESSFLFKTHPRSTPMTQQLIQFVHANSYPADTYRVFLNHLRAHYDIAALPLHAHDPAYPITNGWQALVKELLATLDARRPAILVGHSMGGMLSLMAARARPDLVRGVVLLDAPVVAGWRALLLRLAKAVGIDRKLSPARFSEKRRNVWPDRDAAYAHYAAKPMFAAWPPAVLRDYVEHGTVATEDGVTLRFTREAETAVYRGLPDHLGSLVRGNFPVPVGFIGGADSVECRRAGLRATRRLVGRHFRKIPGGHLFPLEHPAAAATAVHQMAQALLHA
jgi:pimeloyl-ACP methyl ester carboxylesterase